MNSKHGQTRINLGVQTLPSWLHKLALALESMILSGPNTVSITQSGTHCSITISIELDSQGKANKSDTVYHVHLLTDANVDRAVYESLAHNHDVVSTFMELAGKEAGVSVEDWT